MHKPKGQIPADVRESHSCGTSLEPALSESEDHFRGLFENAAVGIVQALPDGRMLLVNDAFCRMLGYSREELLALHPLDITHPEDRAVSGQQIARAAAGEIDGYTLDKRYLRKDGSVLWANLTVNEVCDKAGRPQHAVAIVRDITCRKKAEEDLRQERSVLDAILKSTDVMLVYLDPGFNFLAVNSAYARTCHMRPEEMIGKNHFALYPHAENEAIFRRVRDTGEPVFFKDKPFEFPDQPERGVTYWDWSLTPVKTASGEVTGLVFSLWETTDRKRAEEQLVALNETLEARAAERAAEAERRAIQLRAMAAELSQAEQRERRRLSQVLHDGLQQVLVAARMKVLRLRRKAVGDEALAQVADELDELIDQSISESRSLTVELSPPVLYDGGLALGLQWLARRTEEKHDLAVEVLADPAADPTDENLRVFLFHAVRELLFNVVKHAHAHKAIVSMSRMGQAPPDALGDRAPRPHARPGVRHSLTAPCDWLRIEVCDDGVGCEPARFNGPAGTGGGFGLFSVRERLELLDGRMEVATGADKGTCVVITVPTHEPQPATTPAARQPGTPAPQPQPGRESGLRVLLADDHPVVRKGLADMLREQPGVGMVVEARDGQEAVEMALQAQPDVVVMDITMPRLNGIEATRQIKAAVPHVRVIGLSMHEDVAMAQAMCRAGAEAYLRKDTDSEVLLAAILRKEELRT
jgi:PAS domain S-box-containing protein